MQGYVGSAQDQARIRQLEQAREEETHRLEEAKKAAAAQPKSFRQWEHGTAEVIETAFKKETVGLVSRDEYIEKKSSIQARLEVCLCPSLMLATCTQLLRMLFWKANTASATLCLRCCRLMHPSLCAKSSSAHCTANHSAVLVRVWQLLCQCRQRQAHRTRRT